MKVIVGIVLALVGLLIGGSTVIWAWRMKKLSLNAFLQEWSGVWQFCGWLGGLLPLLGVALLVASVSCGGRSIGAANPEDDSPRYNGCGVDERYLRLAHDRRDAAQCQAMMAPESEWARIIESAAGETNLLGAEYDNHARSGSADPAYCGPVCEEVQQTLQRLRQQGCSP